MQAPSGFISLKMTSRRYTRLNRAPVTYHLGGLNGDINILGRTRSNGRYQLASGYSYELCALCIVAMCCSPGLMTLQRSIQCSVKGDVTMNLLDSAWLNGLNPLPIDIEAN